MNTFIDNVTLEQSIDTQLQMIDCLIKEAVMIQYYQKIFLEGDGTPPTSSPAGGDPQGGGEQKVEPPAPTSTPQANAGTSAETTQQNMPPNPTVTNAKNIAQNPQAKKTWFDRLRTTIGKFFTSISELISPDNVEKKQNMITTAAQNTEQTMEEFEQIPDQQPITDPNNPQVPPKSKEEIKTALLEWIQQGEFNEQNGFKWPEQENRIRQFLQYLLEQKKYNTVFTQDLNDSISNINKSIDGTLQDAQLVRSNQQLDQSADINNTDPTRMARSNETFSAMLMKIDGFVNQATQHVNEKIFRKGYSRNYIRTNTVRVTDQYLDYNEYIQAVNATAQVLKPAKDALAQFQKAVDTFLQELSEQEANGTQTTLYSDPNSDKNPMNQAQHCLQTSKNAINVISSVSQAMDADAWGLQSLENKLHELTPGLNTKQSFIGKGLQGPQGGTNISMQNPGFDQSNTMMKDSTFNNGVTDTGMFKPGGQSSMYNNTNTGRDIVDNRVNRTTFNSTNGGGQFGKFNNNTR